MTGRYVRRQSHLNFFHSSATHYGSWYASVVLEALGSAPSADQTKPPVLVPSFISTHRRTTPIKDRGAGAELSDKAQLPRGLRKWLILHMRTTVQRSSPPQLANSTNSSFLSRILWLAGKIVWHVMWKERSSCLRKPDLYTMSSKGYFLFSALLRTALAAADSVPVATGEGRSAPTLDANSKASKYCLGWALCKRLFLETTYLCSFNPLADPS